MPQEPGASFPALAVCTTVDAYEGCWRDMMEKLDFKKELAELYNPKNRDWELIEVPAMNFLMVDGKGDRIQSRTTATLSRRFTAWPTPSNS
jgi:hypothetical protein